MFFTAAFKEVMKSTSGILCSEWLNYSIKFMVETKTRDTCFGADVQKLRQNKWHVTHIATYLKCGDTCEKMVARVKAVAESVMTNFSEGVGGGGDYFYFFEEAFHEQIIPVF
jgi:hypothetical protein